MEEEIGVKATRMRRKLSTVEDTKSPSTPTKKRGGRLAAKPQLELIDENANEGEKTKNIRKSIARDIEAEDKTITPARRSTRIKSNTSNVSETPVEVEDKGTPSRRSTRIRSNTSIVAETVQYSDSPRARRAARRTSQVGSDNETTITPARQMRRTRKDSTSSIEKQVESDISKIMTQTKEAIPEEMDKETIENQNKRTPTKDSIHSPTIRRSPRLLGKTDQKSSSQNGDNKENELQSVKKLNKDDKLALEIQNSDTEESSHSISNLINELEVNLKKRNIGLNKTTSAIDEHKPKPKRHRTKSWTTVSSSPSNDSYFMSDTEVIKKKNENKRSTYGSPIASGSGDGILNSNNDIQKMKGKQSETSMKSKLIENVTINTSLKSNNKSATELTLPSDKMCTHDCSLTEKILGTAPNGYVESIVYIDDSDSNTSNILKENVNKEMNSEDQCVPVVKHQMETAQFKNNLSHEPMDIDETMPDNVSCFVENNTTVEQSKSDDIFQTSHDRITMKSSSRMSNITSDNDTGLKKSNIETITDMISKDVDTIVQCENKSFISTIFDACTKGNTNQVQPLPEDVNDGAINRKPSISSAPTNNNEISLNNNAVIDICENSNSSLCKRKSSINLDNNIAKNDDGNHSVSSANIKDDNMNKSNRKSSTSVNYIDNNISITNSGNVMDSCHKSREALNTSEDSLHSNTVSHSCNVMFNDSPKVKDSTVFNKGVIQVDSPNKSKKISLLPSDDVEIMNKGSKRSDTNASISSKYEDNSPANIESVVVDVINDDESMTKESKTRKRKSHLSNISNENIVVSANKSSRKSSISHMNSQTSDKMNNEYSSTLVLSQIKDDTNINIGNSEPLSKSLNIPNINRDSDKKNLSLTYSTSTPLQQHSKKKLPMQLNTSVITPSSVSKMKKRILVRCENEPVVSQNYEQSSSSNEEDDGQDDSDEESIHKNVLIDDEAEEASDNYESGDSRDDDEKRYEEENEIVEKGESLDSQEDFSDDSEYEKGSFIVDSDEEDNDLLSGSGDDLSMSADELSMSVKSKMKFNKRKIKEQKKASREMFEARHKLNESDKSAKLQKPKSRKKNRQRLESSNIDLENEASSPQYAKIDSSGDVTINQSDTDNSITYKKKKVRRLSESICEDSATNEKEISIHQSVVTEKDPLSIQNIKKEPKTPQRDLNLTTIDYVEKIKEVDVDENVSILVMRPNQISDPLENSMVQDDLKDSEDSLSENEQITQNYESVLSDLNTKSNNVKTLDLSLNLNKKNKKKAKELIVDELNLTEVKSKKTKSKSTKNCSSKKTNTDNVNKTMETVKKSIPIQDECSSDSIDMKLLFDEDSNDIEIKETVKNDKVEIVIPLKRTEGKTNILESSDDQKTEDLNFFIDTTGVFTDKNDDDDDDVTQNDAMTKASPKKKKQNNISFNNIEEAVVDCDDSNDAPLEVTYQSDKNNKISRKELGTTENDIDLPNKKENIKKKKNLDNTQITTEEQSVKEAELNVESEEPVHDPSVSRGKKQTLKTTSDNFAIQKDKDTAVEQSINRSALSVTNSNKKKKKNKLSSSHTEQGPVQETAGGVSTHNISGSSDMKQNQISSMKSVVENENVMKENDSVINEKAVSKKLKRKRSSNQSIEQVEQENVNILDTSKIFNEITSNQKKKRKIIHNQEDSDFQTQVADVQEVVKQEKLVTKKDKKKIRTEEEPQVDDDIKKKIKKRKRRDYDDGDQISKIIKQNSLDQVHVPRLPSNIIKQLDDKPKKDIGPKVNVISTTSFKVEETKKRNNKPSNYLEQSVYLNDSSEESRTKSLLKKPKVLPFIPTASTSDYGFTTNFRVNVIPQETQFIAQTSDVSNFKNDYLQKNRIKKLGTFETYKRHRNMKLSKF